jgi:hypothetical protein
MVRSRAKKCVFCGKVLSVYNPNPYCFADRAKGIKAIWTAKEKDVFRRYRMQLKSIEKKKIDKEAIKRAKRVSDRNNTAKHRSKRSVRAY